MWFIPLIEKALSFIPDPAQRAQQTKDLISALQAWDSQQNDVNKQEAASSSIFVAGWRPAIGWVCALALFYQYLLSPLAGWVLAVAEISVPEFPKLDENLWQLMFGMLGMGGLRTFEKIKGVAK